MIILKKALMEGNFLPRRWWRTRLREFLSSGPDTTDGLAVLLGYTGSLWVLLLGTQVVLN